MSAPAEARAAVFTTSRDLPVSPDEAFALITEPERLRRWQTVSATVDLRAGGEYRWTVTPGHVAAGTYQEVEPGRRLVFGWGWTDSDELGPDASTVTVTIEPVGSGSRVTISHTGLPTPELVAGHAEGWEHYLDRLEKIAATGDAGPDEWAAVPADLNPITAAEATLAVLQLVLRGLTNADKVKQTPCEDFTCHDLAVHLFGSIVGVGKMVGVEIVNAGTGSLENQVSVLADQALTASRARGLEGTAPAPGGHGEAPVSLAPTILTLEFLLHAWDFAQASGQQVVAADGLVDYVQTLAEQVIPGARGNGSFKAAQPAPAGASRLERLAAFAGRTVPAAAA